MEAKVAAVECNLEGDRDLLCVAPIALCNDVLRAASGFCNGPHEALGRGSPCAGGLNGEVAYVLVWDVVAGLVMLESVLDLRDLSCRCETTVKPNPIQSRLQTTVFHTCHVVFAGPCSVNW